MTFFKKLSHRILKNFKSNKLELHEPIFSKKEISNLNNCIKKGMVSNSQNGFFIKKFENQIKNFVKTKYVACTVNGVSGLHVSLLAAGVKKNEEVFVPSLTFVASAHPILYIGAIPHFVDANLKNFGVCEEKFETYLKKISIKIGNNYYNKKTKRKLSAIIAVHVFGNPCEIDKLKKLAKKYKLKLIEDSTEALGSFYKKTHVGNFGETGVFSFNGNKIITSGGGGAIVTNQKKIYKKISHLISNSKLLHKWEYIHDQVGYNYRMPNINAALASAQFEKLKNIIKLKKTINKKYQKIFSKFKEIKLLVNTRQVSSNNWLNILVIKDRKINKNKLISYFHKKKIYVRPVWKPLHTLKHLKDFPKMNLDNTKKIYDNSISLPSGPGINK